MWEIRAAVLVTGFGPNQHFSHTAWLWCIRIVARLQVAMSQETEQFCRWRQQKVAKSVPYGLPISLGSNCDNSIAPALSDRSRQSLKESFDNRHSLDPSVV